MITSLFHICFNDCNTSAQLAYITQHRKIYDGRIKMDNSLSIPNELMFQAPIPHLALCDWMLL